MFLMILLIFKMFVASQLPSKDASSLISRSIDGGNSLDKKKPFTRPFSKTRLEPTGSSVRMASPTPKESGALLRQNQELRQRLQEESSNYRRRLDTYKQAQSNQSALVGRLQTKVLQYKQRCSELEVQMNDVPLCPQYGEPRNQSVVGTSTPIPTICPKSVSYSPTPMSLPTICQSAEQASRHYSDETGGDDSFERKRMDEERKL